MVETRTCDFSGEEIEPGTGTMYVRNDGTILHFKDSKAEKNYFLGREARDLEWTAEGRASGGQTVPQEEQPADTASEPEPEPEAETEADEAETGQTEADAETDETGANAEADEA